MNNKNVFGNRKTPQKYMLQKIFALLISTYIYGHTNFMFSRLTQVKIINLDSRNVICKKLTLFRMV